MRRQLRFVVHPTLLYQMSGSGTTPVSASASWPVNMTSMQPKPWSHAPSGHDHAHAWLGHRQAGRVGCVQASVPLYLAC